MLEIPEILGLTQFVSIIAGMVWGISKIQMTTSILTNSIMNLDKTIAKLEQACDRVESKLHEHGERLASLEAK